MKQCELIPHLCTTNSKSACNHYCMMTFSLVCIICYEAAFSGMEAMESWAGPGNEAKLSVE